MTSANQTDPSKPARELPEGVVIREDGKVHRYYDALKRPISKAEFIMQSQWEKEHGRPYVTLDETPANPNHKRQIPQVTSYGTEECPGEATGIVSGENACTAVDPSQSVKLGMLPRNCNVFTYSDENCQENPLVAAQGPGITSGCYEVSSFSSAQIICTA